MTPALIDLEVRFLLARYGEQGVLKSIAEVRHQPVEALHAQLSALESAKKSRIKKPQKSGEEIVRELVDAADDHGPLMLEAAAMFEQRRLLPALKDVHDFVRRTTGREQKIKSRRESLHVFLRALLSLPLHEIRKLLEEAKHGESSGDYELLANQIMTGR